MQDKFGFKGYGDKQASSFWLGSAFDTDFKGEDNRKDYTKLAAAQRAIANFVNIVTGKQIPVVFQSNDNSYTDGEQVVIGTKLDDKNFDSAVGLALHEGSHIAYTDFSLFKGATRLSNSPFANHVRMRGLDPDLDMTESDFELIKDLLNWIEDRRIDYKIYTNAPGYRMYYEAMYNKYFNDKVIDKALIAGEKSDESLESYLFHIINFTNPLRQLDTLAKLRDIWNLIDLRNISRLNTTTDALDVACDIYKVIKSAVAEAESQSSASSASSTSDVSQDSSGSNMSGDGGEEADDSDSADNDASGNGSGMSSADMKRLDKAINQQKDFLRDNLKKVGRLTKSDAQIVDAIKQAGTETRNVNTSPGSTFASGECPVTTVVIKKLTPGIIDSLPELFHTAASDFISGKRVLDTNSYYARTILELNTAVQDGIVLGKKLGNKLQLRNTDRSLKTTRLVAGKIDRRLVAQLGYQNANVFHRIVTDRYKNYFLHISIDASGSMSGKKFNQAIKSAVAIAQAASMTTGIRVQISLRGTGNIGSRTEKAVTIYAYDSAHDKMNKIKTYFKYLSTFGCTPEGIAFKSIEQDIVKDAKGDECIFINYSDGEPTPVYGVADAYSGIRYTRYVVNGFREQGINVISYFIFESRIYDSTRDNFKTMYGPDAAFIDPTNMMDVAKSMNAKFLEITK